MENLKSFPVQDENSSHNFTTYSEYLNWSLENQKNLKPYEQRRSVFTLFQNYEKKHPFNTKQILDLTTWQDLNLLCGPRSAMDMYAAKKVSRPKTEFGTATLYRMIVDPVASIEELDTRQAISKELIQNVTLFEELDKAFDDLHNAEKLLLSFWRDDAFQAAAQRKEIRFPKQPGFIDSWNKNSLIVECNERLDEAREILLLGCQAAGALVLPTIAYLALTNNTDNARSLKTFAQEHLGVSTLVGFMSAAGISSMILKAAAGSNRITDSVNNAAVASTYGLGLYYSYDSVKSNTVLITAIQTKLMALPIMCVRSSILKSYLTLMKYSEKSSQRLGLPRTSSMTFPSFQKTSTS